MGIRASESQKLSYAVALHATLLPVLNSFLVLKTRVMPVLCCEMDCKSEPKPLQQVEQGGDYCSINRNISMVIGSSNIIPNMII